MFKILKKIKVKLMHYTWDLALLGYNEGIFHETKRLSKYKLLKNPYKTKWFADPFILNETKEHLFILVEEFDSNVNRGRIAKLKVHKSTSSIIDCKILLDLPTHLSFPVIYYIDDSIIVHPENSASGQSIFYKYDIEEEKFLKIDVVSDLPLTDAIIANHWDDHGFYLFTTQHPNSNGDNLLIFHTDKLINDFKLHSTFVFNSNIARMAGNIIRTDNEVIRPAQDCNGSYGKSVIFQKIDFLKEKFSFINIGELKPPYWYDGLHTFNSYKNRIAIVDLKRYDYPLFYRCVKLIKKIIN